MTDEVPTVPPDPFMEFVYFESIAKLVREQMAKRSPYGDNGAYQWARRAASRARRWHPELAEEEQ